MGLSVTEIISAAVPPEQNPGGIAVKRGGCQEVEQVPKMLCEPASPARLQVEFQRISCAPVLVYHCDPGRAEHFFSRRYNALAGGATAHYNPGHVKEPRNPLQKRPQFIKVHYTHQR